MNGGDRIAAVSHEAHNFGLPHQRSAITRNTQYSARTVHIDLRVSTLSELRSNRLHLSSVPPRPTARPVAIALVRPATWNESKQSSTPVLRCCCPKRRSSTNSPEQSGNCSWWDSSGDLRR